MISRQVDDGCADRSANSVLSHASLRVHQLNDFQWWVRDGANPLRQSVVIQRWQIVKLRGQLKHLYLTDETSYNQEFVYGYHRAQTQKL